MTMGQAGSLEREGRALVERLGGRWGEKGGMCRCPAHRDRTPSLSVRPGRSRLLFHCFAGCAAADILRLLESRGLLVPAAPSTSSRSIGTRRSGTGAAHAVWDRGRSVAGTLAARYLEARGLRGDWPDLRYNARTPHGRAPLTCFRPALVAAVRDDTGLVAVHRTFIDRSGLHGQPRVSVRRGLGRFGRGAVRLGGTGPRLGLAEGIETALSASLLFGLPCWATLGSARFGLIALPPDIEELALFLDNDAAGRRAERLAREAYGHVPQITAHYPEPPGADWNDVLRSGAPAPAA